MSDIVYYTDNGKIVEAWANDLIKAEQVNFEGWICGIGLESIEIRSDGSIYRGVCKVGGPIGHVNDEKWNLPTDFIVCNKKQCTCVADVKSTRYVNQETKDKLQNMIKERILKNGGANPINI